MFEDFHLKHRLFLEMENYIPENAIMASSSGQMFASRLSEGLKRKTRLVVVHPVRNFCSPINPFMPSVSIGPVHFRFKGCWVVFSFLFHF